MSRPDAVPYDRRLAEGGRPIKWRDGSGFLMFVAADDYGGLVCRDPADMQLIHPTKSAICMASADEVGPMSEAFYQSVIVPLGGHLKQARENHVAEVLSTGAFARDVRFATRGFHIRHAVHEDGGATYYADEQLEIE